MNCIKSLIILLFISISYCAPCQVKYVLGKDQRLDSIECNLNDSESIKVQFDRKGRVNKIFKLQKNQVHGFVYYLRKNKLDSIRRYDEGKLTHELYIFKKDGSVGKHILFLGQDRDTTYGIKNGRTIRWPPFPLSMGINTQMYELDSNGYLIRIYDQDIEHHFTSSKYNVHFSSHGKYISSVYTFYEPEEVMFLRGELAGLYSYQRGFYHGFRFYFYHYPSSRIKRLSILRNGKEEVLLFKKSGKLKMREI